MRRMETNFRGPALGLIITTIMAIALSIQSNSCLVVDTDTLVCARTGVRCPAGWTCTQEQDGCTQDGCGDGVMSPGEECDDGNVHGGDGCSSTCHLEICGNGIMDPDEDCDDGKLNGTTNCSSTCKNLTCGDGIFNPMLNEQCDGGGSDTPFCNKDCTLAVCGDGYVNILHLVPTELPGIAHNEICDEGQIVDGVPVPRDTATCDSDCTPVACGDGHRNKIAGEGCDDGILNNNIMPDACRTNCQPAFCGDGVRDHGEECDDGADLEHDLDHDGNINSDTIPNLCRTTCHQAFCGDGVKDHGEECDDGADLEHDLDHDGQINNDIIPNACRTNCRRAFCGDGVIDSDEICDKGNDDHPAVGCLSGKRCNNSCQACN